QLGGLGAWRCRLIFTRMHRVSVAGPLILGSVLSHKITEWLELWIAFFGRCARSYCYWKAVEPGKLDRRPALQNSGATAMRLGYFVHDAGGKSCRSIRATVSWV